MCHSLKHTNGGKEGPKRDGEGSKMEEGKNKLINKLSQIKINRGKERGDRKKTKQTSYMSLGIVEREQSWQRYL